MFWDAMENAVDCNGKRRLAVLSVHHGVARYHDAKIRLSNQNQKGFADDGRSRVR